MRKLILGDGYIPLHTEKIKINLTGMLLKHGHNFEKKNILYNLSVPVDDMVGLNPTRSCGLSL